MKQYKKYLILYGLITVIFLAVLVNFNIIQFNAIKENSNEAILKVVAAVKEKYPDITDRELALILNNKTEPSQVYDSLESYGIVVSDDWVAYDNDALSRNFICVNVAVCAFACLSLSGVFFVYSKLRNKDALKLTQYIQRINNKDYDLEIDANSLDEMSQLKNEIYKTTVMLKEQSCDSLKDKEKLKDSLSDISHQLKTPLTSAMVLTDNMLEDEEMPTEIRREFLSDIRRSVNNMSFLVQSLLTLSKLDANTIVFKPQIVKITDIFTQCLSSTAVISEIKRVEVMAECNEAYSLYCDAAWIAEALSNIIKNCIEHTSEGGCVKVTVDQNGFCTKISISDNGCGISKKDLPHIFERFYKGSNSNSDSVGIGLALAKTIIEKSNGYISVDSQENKGTTFDIRFFSSI